MKKEKKKVDKNQLYDSVRGNVFATVAAFVITVSILFGFLLFRAGELGGKLVCEAAADSGTETFVYDFSTRKKTLLWVDGYTDISRVTGYTGEGFYCCAKREGQPYILSVKQGKAEYAFAAERLPNDMTALGESLYLLLGEAENGAVVRLQPDTGEQTVLQTGVYVPAGFAVSEDGLICARFNGECLVWIVSSRDGEKQILQSSADVSVLAFYGSAVYFQDRAAGRLFSVSSQTAERKEVAVLPAFAKAEDGPQPLFAFSYETDRHFICISAGDTPLKMHVFLISGRFTMPIVPFGLTDKNKEIKSVRWI